MKPGPNTTSLPEGESASFTRGLHYGHRTLISSVIRDGGEDRKHTARIHSLQEDLPLNLSKAFRAMTQCTTKQLQQSNTLQCTVDLRSTGIRSTLSQAAKTYMRRTCRSSKWGLGKVALIHLCVLTTATMVRRVAQAEYFWTKLSEKIGRLADSLFLTVMASLPSIKTTNKFQLRRRPQRWL